MSLVILFPGTLQTPDPATPGDQTITGQTDTGMPGNSVIDTGPETNQQKSCRWSAFNKYAAERHTFPYNSTHHAQRITLKFNWAVTVGEATAQGAGSSLASVSFIIGYSTDGGSSFTDVVTKSASVVGVGTQSIVDSGSVSVDIPTTPVKDLSQFAVRARMLASASALETDTADARVTANVSNLQLEVVTRGAQPIVMM